MLLTQKKLPLLYLDLSESYKFYLYFSHKSPRDLIGILGQTNKRGEFQHRLAYTWKIVDTCMLFVKLHL
ncbi:hypothetical protein A2863_01585 [Candidatus Woesebacteria bacterium RIFCSPHIGHO2_01_FULL_38_9b]|uniref:Uncharacterized protein n=1 Tax=Candidatus Woesebacteria bacterium RIFCSPHIGHO2_01_FULL_38_9b TaxID=1802493 RepID=A0A1F7Y0M0_9BACT|nr:MAG: hypothetical protein A2863_01585 [Candidatus Woesebacteria bacterium RIFCSPHIGHO2_01_FULL_38_9b]